MLVCALRVQVPITQRSRTPPIGFVYALQQLSPADPRHINADVHEAISDVDRIDWNGDGDSLRKLGTRFARTGNGIQTILRYADLKP